MLSAESHTESEFVAHEPCPACGSRNNLARYSDGHAYCFGCGHYEFANDEEEERMGEAATVETLSSAENREQKAILTLEGEIKDLPKRGLREDTLKHWQYRVGTVGDKPAQLAYYFDPNTRKPVACKVRFPDKSFTWIGNPKDAPLYGQWLWRDGGKMVVVTEGEIDSISVSQIQGGKWPVVSVQNGAQGASKSIRKAIDWLNKFETVVFMFDMDDAGRKAAIECAKLLPPGKAKIANLKDAKDANDLLTAGRGAEIIDAIWSATTYRPDGIISARDLWDRVSSFDTVSSVDYPFSGLSQKTGGIRKQELVTITAGSGIGKSLFCREIAYDLMINHGWKIGYIALEENAKRTVLGFMGIDVNYPLHIHQEEAYNYKSSFEKVTKDLYLYDSFGSIEPDNLIERLRYLAVGLQCDALFLDHISIALSGLEDIDERRALDVMMTRLRSLVEETGVAMFVVSHVRRAQGDKGYEQGQMLSLSALRGSHAIAQLSDIVLGMERNQQGDNPNETVVRVLKNRFSGDTGVACSLMYSKETGRLTEEAFSKEAEDVPF